MRSLANMKSKSDYDAFLQPGDQLDKVSKLSEKEER
jgi:hypothetical protein